MAQRDPEPQFPPAADAAPIVHTGRPAVVAAAGGVMLALAVIGAVAATVALAYHVTWSPVEIDVTAIMWDYEFRYILLLLALCVVVAALAVVVWQGSSAARLAVFATLGTAATLAAAAAASELASVVYGIDHPYEEEWRQTLITMWAYLFAAAIIAAPIPLLNRPSATKWFRHKRSARPFPAASDPVNCPEVLSLVTTALVVLALLTVVGKGWHIGEIVSGGFTEPGDVPQSLIRTLAHATIPLLILTAAIIETGSGSRLGQTAAFMAGGYACFQGLERLPTVFEGSWLRDWQEFGNFFTTIAIGVIGAATLLLLLRPKVVDYLAYQAVDIEPDFELAATADDDEDD